MKYYWFISGIVLVLLLIFLLSWQVWVPISTHVHTTIPTDEKILYLTFDDGPGIDTTTLLEVLSEKNVTATFFIVGERIPWQNEIVTKIISQRHLIGNHGYAHSFGLFRGKEDYLLGKKALEDMGITTQLYRPPYGFRSLGTLLQTKKDNTQIILWNIMPHDYRGWDAEQISSYVLKRVQPGSIITLHDGPENKEETVQAVSNIIDEARKEGYRFESLPTYHP